MSRFPFKSWAFAHSFIFSNNLYIQRFIQQILSSFPYCTRHARPPAARRCMRSIDTPAHPPLVGAWDEIYPPCLSQLLSLLPARSYSIPCSWIGVIDTEVKKLGIRNVGHGPCHGTDRVLCLFILKKPKGSFPSFQRWLLSEFWIKGGCEREILQAASCTNTPVLCVKAPVEGIISVGIPLHSQTSRLLTSSLSLGVPVPLTAQCMWDV